MVKIIILGTAQDGGIPHFMCKCENCQQALENPIPRYVSSIAILGERKTVIVDATPDIVKQYRLFDKLEEKPELDSILITHLHMGHYTGLMYFGKESISSKEFPVHLTRENYLTLLTSKPSSYLFTRKELIPRVFRFEEVLYIEDSFSIVPFEVPHRNQEEGDNNTVGIEITNHLNNKKALFISDVDTITDEIKKRISTADKVIFDGTFFGSTELGRQKTIPHPSIEETIKIFGEQPLNKFYFTHINHTNPILDENSFEFKKIKELNYIVCREGMEIEF
jgi:pyrroloquinoline quinone biosynthesis protein B